MSTTPAAIPKEEPFDQAKFIATRNGGQVQNGVAKPAIEAKAEEPKKPEPEKPVATEPEDEHSSHWSRSQLKTLNQAKHRAALAEGRAQMLQELINSGQISASKATAAAVIAPEQEPERKNYASDAEHAAAVGRFAARQEVSKANAEGDLERELREQIKSAGVERDKQIPLIPEWDKVLEAAEELNIQDQPVISMLLALSPFAALVAEYWVANPKEWERLAELKGNEIKQRELFHRIEGKVETVYTTRLQAAQAAKAKPPKEDRSDAAQATAGQTAASAGSARLPKPSSEVAASGGSTPPAEPQIGSAAWMAARNERFSPRR